MPSDFRTTDPDLAAYIHVSAHRCEGVEYLPSEKKGEFRFPRTIQVESALVQWAEGYAEVNARDYARARVTLYRQARGVVDLAR